MFEWLIDSEESQESQSQDSNNKKRNKVAQLVHDR